MEWVILASRIEANIYENTDGGSLKLLKKMRNPLGRMKNKAMQDDQAGMSRAKYKGVAPYSLTGKSDLHTDAAIQFVRKLINYLKSQWRKNHELAFKIVAEPKLLGMLKSQFGKSKILNRVTWVDKDLQNIPPSKWPNLLGLKKIPMKKDMKILTLAQT